MSIRSSWEELKRRNVVRVGVAYVAGAVGVGAAADVFLPGLGAPAWVLRTVLGILVVGLPLALVLAWAYDVTPRGIERTEPGESGAMRPARARPSVPGTSWDSRKSIVVLPFDNMSPDPDDAFFSDGLTEEVTADLSRIRTLGVISRTSAMRLKGTDKDVRTIGRELGVGYVLEGSVRKSGRTVRITAQLIDASTDEHLWAEKYTGSIDDVFDIQERVAGAIARALRIELSPRERMEISDRGTGDSRAYESYLRARYEMYRFSREGLEAALRHLRTGLEIVGDDEALLAVSGLAHIQHRLLGIDSDPVHVEAAEAVARRLLQVFPDSRRADGLSGFIAFAKGDMAAACIHLQRALEANPDDPDALVYLGYALTLVGREDRAAPLFERLVRVDPLTPMNHAMLGFVAIVEGRHEDALEPYHTYLEMDDRGAFSLHGWIFALVHLEDRLDEATAASEELVSRHPESPHAGMGTAWVLARRGRGAEACRAISPVMLAAARENEMLSRFLTQIYAMAGDAESALHWLENDMRLGNANHPYWSRTSPLLGDLRSDPRFAELMRAMEKTWRRFGDRHGRVTEADRVLPA